MEDLSFFLTFALIVFGLSAFIQLLFPVEVYEKVKNSDSSIATKGRFAYTVESLYQIKTNWFDADPKYWWHIIWFDSAVSFGVSAIATIGLAIIIGIVITAIALILLSMFINS